MTVEPNRRAGPLEEAMLRENISVEEEDLDRVQGRLKNARHRLRDAQLALAATQEAMDTASAIVAQTEAYEETLTRSLARSRGLLHPIRRLPSEVLAVIFLQRLDDAIDSDYHNTELRSVPFLLASICRKWRSIALETPFLWAHIVLDFQQVQACVQPWNDYLVHVLRYSAHVALALRLRTAPNHDESSPINRIWVQLMHALRRARSLRVHCHSIGYSKWRRLIVVEALELEFCEIHCYDDAFDETVAIPILPTSPRLRHLRLVEAYIDWSIGKRYDSLRELSFIMSDKLMASDFATAATRFPNLVQLELYACLNAPTPTSITFSSLRSLRICMSADNTNAAQSFLLPALEEASLNLQSSASTALMLRTSLSRSPRLSKLTILSIEANAEISDAVAMHANLKELVLGACHLTDEFCRSFARSGPSGHRPCPRLSTLHIVRILPTAERVTFDGAALLELVRDRIGSASDQASTLHEVVVTWESGADYSVEGFDHALDQIML